MHYELINNILIFQKTLNEAIGWWLDTGIYFKMESDIMSEYGSQRDSWSRPKISGDRPLGLSHVIPSFIIFGVATFVSILAFSLEKIPSWYMKHVQGKRFKLRRVRRRYLRQRMPPHFIFGSRKSHIHAGTAPNCTWSVALKQLVLEEMFSTVVLKSEIFI